MRACEALGRGGTGFVHQADPHPAWERTDMVRPVAGSGLAWGTGGVGLVHQADPPPVWERTDMARPVAGSCLGAGLHFRKYFEKFAGFVRREKFPKICRDRRVMGPSDPLKLLSDHSRPPGTNLKRPAVDMIYSILKDITLEGHQVPAYVWIWHFMWRRPSRRNPNLESYDRYIRRLHYL